VPEAVEQPNLVRNDTQRLSRQTRSGVDLSLYQQTTVEYRAGIVNEGSGVKVALV